MISRKTYRFAIIGILLFAVTDGYSQSCKKNMLVIPDGNSYAVSNLPKNIPTGALTVECWAKDSSFTIGAGLVEYGDANDTGAFSLRFGSGQFLVATFRTNNAIVTIASPAISNFSQWHHYALTFTPNDSIKLFIDGQLSVGVATTATSLVGSWNSLFVGHSGTTAQSFLGSIDEVRIWSVTRSAAQILASKNTPLAGNENGLACYYMFDDDPGGSIIHNFTGKGTELSKISNAFLSTSTAPIQGPPSDGYMIASKELRIDFSDLLCDSTATAIVHIYNRGPESIDIGGIGFVRGTVFTASSGGGFPLAGNDTTHTASVTIQVNISKPGFYSDTLIVAASTICGGLVKIPVTIRKDLIKISFDTAAFDIGDILNCNLPIERQTRLFNTGTKPVTISSLDFFPTTSFKIISPIPPFTIDSGDTTVVKFRIKSGPAQSINSVLTAATLECPVQAKRQFIGNRIAEQFTVTPEVIFPSLPLPPGQIQLDTVLYFKNTGNSTITFSPAMALQGSNNFRLISPSNGLALIKPDSTLAIKIRFTGADCGPYQADLHLSSNTNCGFDTLIPINITILPPLLSSVTENFDLGAGCTIRDTVITFVNKSGRQILLGSPVFSDPALTLQSFGVLPKQLNAGDSVSLTFRFAPAKPGEYTIYTRMSLSPCGDKTLTFHGFYGVGKIAQSDSAIDFGSGCDLRPDTQTITIQNLTGKNVTVSDTSTKLSSHFTIVSPVLPFTITNGSAQVIRVRYSPAALAVERSEITLLDQNDCYITTIKTKAVREIAAITSSVNNNRIEFGVICPSDTGMFSLHLKNIGFGEVTLLSVAFHGTSVYDTIGNQLGLIPSGNSKSVEFNFIPKDTGEFTGWVELVFGPCNDTLSYILHGIGGPKPEFLSSSTLLDFGPVKLGQSDTLCLTLTNPSCLPIKITPASLGVLPNGFLYDSHTLPDSVWDDHSVEFCFIFSPQQTGVVSVFDTITTGDHRVIVELKGKGVTSDLSISPRSIDFGDVLNNTTSKPASIYIVNNGDAAATIDTQQPAKDFHITSSLPQIGAFAKDSIVVTFAPTASGSQQSFVVLNWDAHSDTIILKGRGTGPGPLFSVSSIDFSRVRVKHDSSIRIFVSAPPDSQITITDISITPPFTISPQGPIIISSGTPDSFTITYSPVAEVFDSVQLRIKSIGASDALLPVTGLGVDAHIAITPDSVGFGDVALHSLGDTRPITVTNTGGYPLALQSKKLQSAVFGISPDPMSVGAIAPHDSARFTIIFIPQRAQSYRDSLFITADAVEKTAGAILTGRGVFAPLGIPQISYTLPDIQARVGDIVNIPVEIGGADLSLIDIDSFSFDLRYDPLVVFFYGTAFTQGTLSEGCNVDLQRHGNDTVHIVGKGKRLAPVGGVLCYLQAEALLGPRDSTSLVIEKSNPPNSEPLQSSEGSFLVTDCGNYRGGILFKGNYSLPPGSPNPTSDIITIPFELGLAARVKIELYDQMGRNIRTLLDANRGIGKHELVVHLNDLPSGEYYYTLESLEYKRSQKVFLTK